MTPSNLHPDAQFVLDEMAEAIALDAKPLDDAVWVGLYRAQLHEFRRFAGEAVTMRKVTQRMVELNGHPSRLRTYTPPSIRTDVGVLYFHGGGFVGGSLDTHDRLARSIAVASGSPVFALDYPLAPEQPFPAASETCFAAYRWLQENAGLLELDPRKLVVIGDSVGGLFAAVVAILCRDRGLPAPALQISLYPNMDLRIGRNYPSMEQYDGLIVKLAELDRGLAHYVPNPTDRTDPRASPLACPDLRGLATAWVLTCECDPLRDEGRRWVSRLKQAGVAVTHREAQALPHAFLQMGGRVTFADEMFSEIGTAIAEVGVRHCTDLSKTVRTPAQLTERPTMDMKTRRPKSSEMKGEKQTYPAKQSAMKRQPISDLADYKPAGKLQDKVALITGGDSGIGRAIAIAYAMEGANVAILYDQNDDDAKDTRQMVEDKGRRCEVIRADVRSSEACRAAVERTVKTFGKLDILVNNAAFQETHQAFADVTEEEFRRTFETNIFGYFFMAQAALPHLKEGSAIINTGSIVGLIGHTLLIPYSASKGAVHAFTKALALNLGEQNIRVNTVIPGPIWTPNIPGTMPIEEIDNFGYETAMKRPGQPEEVAPVYVMLASSDSSYMTGSQIEVTGGVMSSR